MTSIELDKIPLFGQVDAVSGTIRGSSLAAGRLFRKPIMTSPAQLAEYMN